MVLDAAVLLEAKWDAMVHEVWVCVIPQQEVGTGTKMYFYIFTDHSYQHTE